MKLIIASNNKYKLKEIKAILGDCFNEIVSLSEAGIMHDTVEDGNSFYENAYKKAKEICDISGCCALADDSGLCVDALDGAPGIYSARFCGKHGDDEANNDLLLEKLKDSNNRNAHYTCCIVMITPEGKVYSAEDYMYGTITTERHGNGGFGYDPLFYLPEFGCTVAEISADEKNKISHRAKALKKLKTLLSTF